MQFKIIGINLFSTIYYNFITFSLSKVIRFPILIFRKGVLKNARKGIYVCIYNVMVF